MLTQLSARGVSAPQHLLSAAPRLASLQSLSIQPLSAARCAPFAAVLQQLAPTLTALRVQLYGAVAGAGEQLAAGLAACAGLREITLDLRKIDYDAYCSLVPEVLRRPALVKAAVALHINNEWELPDRVDGRRMQLPDSATLQVRAPLL